MSKARGRLTTSGVGVTSLKKYTLIPLSTNALAASRANLNKLTDQVIAILCVRFEVPLAVVATVEADGDALRVVGKLGLHMSDHALCHLNDDQVVETIKARLHPCSDACTIGRR